MKATNNRRLARDASFFLFIFLAHGFVAKAEPGVSAVRFPENVSTNSFYVGNRAPLEPGRFVSLPIGAVQANGWLKEMLRRQGDGLSGHLGEISVWLEKDDNAWLSRDGKGKHGWEEVPYWLRGYIEMAYLLNDSKMIAESQTWIEGALHSQRSDGDFGPDQRFSDDGSRDFWANMLMMYCLETNYEHSHDGRVLDLLRRYFKFQLTVPDDQFLTHYWQKMRGGDNLYSVYWFYNRTGEDFALELAQKIHRCTANWEKHNDLPNWHNVNISEGFREPAEYFLQTHNRSDLEATYQDFREVRRRYGQVPGGMFGSDENCRPGYSDPRQAVETCGMVEQMFSDELLLQITGDTAWADNCEDVAFNTYPAALMPDLRALRYLTAPNMAVSDAKNHAPGIENGGPFLLMNPFSSRCCQHNHSMGWPNLIKHLWLATPDNGLCAAIYSASEVAAQAGDGTTVRIEEQTHYPFESAVQFTFHPETVATYPIYLRVPGWCASAAVSINGQSAPVKVPAGQYIRIEREWHEGDVVHLDLLMTLSLEHWPANHNAVSVNYGPLTFALKIGERYEQQNSTANAMGDSGWQKSADPTKWPSFAIYPTTPWNYGLALTGRHPENDFKLTKRNWPTDDFPFVPEAVPIELTARARRIPPWKLDSFELVAPLQAGPAWSDQPVENVTLIPMGAARLRISAFPVVEDAPSATHWHAPEPPPKS